MTSTGLASAAIDIPVIALLQARIPARHLGKPWPCGRPGSPPRSR